VVAFSFSLGADLIINELSWIFVGFGSGAADATMRPYGVTANIVWCERAWAKLALCQSNGGNKRRLRT
jgi:hypothetical protein